MRGLCHDVTPCAEDAEVKTPSDGAHDQVCQCAPAFAGDTAENPSVCTPCPPGTGADAGSIRCERFSPCPDGQFLAGEPPECQDVTPCAENAEVKTPSDGSNDQVCQCRANFAGDAEENPRRCTPCPRVLSAEAGSLRCAAIE